MGNEKRLIFIVILLIPFIGWTQICDSSKNVYPQAKNKWYLRDTCYDKVKFEEVSSDIKTNDTALVHQIIENGSINKEYDFFFNMHSIPVKRISYDDFQKLPVDSISLTSEEKKTEAQLDKLLVKLSRRASQGKSIKGINKEMIKPKYENLRNKIRAGNPLLFIMYPIYTFERYQLVMYFVVGQKRSLHSFKYEICSVN